MDDWEKFNETPLLEQENFYSQLNMEDNTYADQAYAKRVCKESEMKNQGKYYVLYVQSNTLLLTDVFENHLIMCSQIYELDPAIFFFCSWISIANSFKTDKSKIRSFNWYLYVINYYY